MPEIPRVSSGEISEQWLRSAEQLRDDLVRIVADLSEGRRPSADLFVPNYWKAAIKLPEKQGAPFLELWHLAHDVGKEVMRTDITRFRVIRAGVEGMQYYADAENA